jgi:hypothetical protein
MILNLIVLHINNRESTLVATKSFSLAIIAQGNKHVKLTVHWAVMLIYATQFKLEELNILPREL